MNVEDFLDCLLVVGLVILIGAIVLGIGIFVYMAQNAKRIQTEDYQVSVSEANQTFQVALTNLSTTFNVYQASFKEKEPYITTNTLDDFLHYSTVWNITAIMYDPFQQRRIGFLGLDYKYVGYFWFHFLDGVVNVQVRYFVGVKE